MTEQEAKRVKAITDDLVAVLNKHDGGKIGERVQALAYVSAWTLLHIGGSGRIDEAVQTFDLMVSDFIAGLSSSETARADQTSEKVEAQARRQRQQH